MIAVVFKKLSGIVQEISDMSHTQIVRSLSAGSLGR